MTIYHHTFRHRLFILSLSALLTLGFSTVSQSCHAQSIALHTAPLTQLQGIHPWWGAHVAYFGDSITDPRNSGSKKKYWAYLQDLLHITPYVYGVSGREWSDIPRQLKKLKAEHGNDFDAIVILMGTNDYNHGVRIGQWYTEADTMVYAAVGKPKQLVKRRCRRFCYDPNTFRGRINIAMKMLRDSFSDKQIVLLTPLHRALFDPNDKNVQPDERIQNSCGEYVDAYVQSVKEAGQVWAVPVIDLGAKSGLFPLINGTTYYHHAHDLLHPNDAGHLRMAKTLVYQLMTLPLNFATPAAE